MEPTLSVTDPYWLSADSFDGGKLCVRRSYWMDDSEMRHDYPEVARFIDRNSLEVAAEFVEDDDYVMGGARVLIYEVAA